MVVPVPLPRHNIPPKDAEELSDKLTDDGEKSDCKASTKTSSSDSGIEDGKITPTLEEEKVLLVKYYFIYRRYKYSPRCIQ